MSAPSAELATDAARPAPWRRVTNVPVPWLFAGLLTLILVIGEYRYQILGGYERLLIAHACAWTAEIVFSRVLRGKFPYLLSAYITANSVAILVKSGPLWPFVLAPLISIASKYALTWRGRHLWNPTNFGISILLAIAPHSMAILSHEWSNSLFAVGLVFAIGFAVARKARLTHISGTYLAAFVVLGVVRSFITGHSIAGTLAPATGPMYLLFVFFMITDPRTVVSTVRGRVVVAILIALCEFAIRLTDLDALHVPQLEFLLRAPPLFALAIVGPIAKLIDIRRTSA